MKVLLGLAVHRMPGQGLVHCRRLVPVLVHCRRLELELVHCKRLVPELVHCRRLELELGRCKRQAVKTLMMMSWMKLSMMCLRKMKN